MFPWFTFRTICRYTNERIPYGHTWPTQTLLKNVHAILIIVITRGTGKLVFKTEILFVVK